MTSWWDLGEGSGHYGRELQLHRITCAFCGERGNWEYEHRATKQKSNSSKTLHFDTLRCGNCAGYVMVLWSAQEMPGPNGLYSYRVLPWPTRLEKHPEHWPDDVGRFWIQAHRSLTDENFDAATMTARSALQLVLREHSAQGKSLKQEINDLATKGLLPPLMTEWANEIRELGNDSAHPSPGQGPTEPQDARDIVRFLDSLMEYLYNLPHEIKQYRLRRGEG